MKARSHDGGKRHVVVYTDGACCENPGGPGGWGAILIYKGHEKAISGRDPSTTNNRMEMMAAIMALECLKEPCSVTLHSDSSYLVDSINEGWAKSWQRNGWVRSSGDPAKNPDLWARLLALGETHDVAYVKVRGHGDDSYNIRCDKLAVDESKKAKKAKDHERKSRSGVAP